MLLHLAPVCVYDFVCGLHLSEREMQLDVSINEKRRAYAHIDRDVHRAILSSVWRGVD